MGVKLGFLMGTFLALLAALGWSLGGEEAFGKLHVGLLQVIVLDIAIASTLGGIVGLLRPVVRSRIGAFVVGCILALPVALLIGVMRGEGLPKEALDWFVPLVFSLAMGGSLGLIFRDIFSR